MQKIDRDFRSGVLCTVEIEDWLEGPEPQKTFETVSKFWGTNTKPPEILIGSRTAYDYRFPKTITVNLMQEIQVANIFEKNGFKIPFSTILKANLADSMTEYLSFQVNPKELKLRDTLFEKFQRTEELMDLMNYAALFSKTMAKGFLARKAVTKNVPDYATASNTVCKNVTKKLDRKLQKLLLNEKDIKNPSDETNEMTAYVFTNAVIGTGETIAEKLEKDYKCRMPELIRDWPKSPFRGDFINYVKKNAPGYGNFINQNIKAKLF